LGPSGSGKSTLGCCINGLIPHAFPGRLEGGLSILGEDAGDLSMFDISKKAGTVLQDTDGQFVGLSSAEDIAFALENDCVPLEEMRRRVREAAFIVGMEAHLFKSPQDLSGGQKQRISMAGVLIDDVNILLFDEPLANLDPEAGKDAMETIDRLHRETGKTIIIIEHRLEDALYRPVDRIIVIDKGRIVADLPPSRLLASTGAGSGILRDVGIREPLYLSALSYAGIEIKPEDVPEDINRIVFDSGKLNVWNKKLPEIYDKPLPAPLLEIKNLSFSYGSEDNQQGVKLWSLKDISCSLPVGAAVSLVGKNGAGKSTLAKLICGFEKADSGSIFFSGEDLSGLSIKERADRVGYVMQNPNQMFSFPLIFDEAALALRSRGMAEGEVKDRVYDAFKICGIYPFRKWPISALSYGQKKRLSIASILVTDVKLLILDEPTAGQDYRHYTEIMEFLKSLNKERGLTILMITHDMHLMLEYSDKTLVIADGCLKGNGGGGLLNPPDVLTDDDLIRTAALKRTSLYDLALRAGIEDSRGFVRRFIEYEKEMRTAAMGGAG
jgi:energy-coupling factor transport system ATP-binding protein